MHKTVEAIVDENGQIKLLEPIELAAQQRLLVTVMDQPADEEFINGVPVTALLAEPALREYWDRPEEDEAWREFQDKAK